jgi:hypothetical protein
MQQLARRVERLVWITLLAFPAAAVAAWIVFFWIGAGR